MKVLPLADHWQAEKSNTYAWNTQSRMCVVAQSRVRSSAAACFFPLSREIAGARLLNGRKSGQQHGYYLSWNRRLTERRDCSGSSRRRWMESSVVIRSLL